MNPGSLVGAVASLGRTDTRCRSSKTSKSPTFENKIRKEPNRIRSVDSKTIQRRHNILPSEKNTPTNFDVRKVMMAHPQFDAPRSLFQLGGQFLLGQQVIVHWSCTNERRFNQRPHETHPFPVLPASGPDRRRAPPPAELRSRRSTVHRLISRSACIAAKWKTCGVAQRAARARLNARLPLPCFYGGTATGQTWCPDDTSLNRDLCFRVKTPRLTPKPE